MYSLKKTLKFADWNESDVERFVNITDIPPSSVNKCIAGLQTQGFRLPKVNSSTDAKHMIMASIWLRIRGGFE